MTDLSTRQIAWLRDELGDNPPDAELHIAFERLGTVRDVAISVVRRRLTNMTNRPASVAISGVTTVSFGDNIRALERQLARLQVMDPDPSDDPVGGDHPAGPAQMVIRNHGGARRRRR